jgi:hypothetical protein
MQTLLPYLRQKNNVLAIILMAMILLFSQHYLFQHELEHEIAGHESAELCKLCITAQNSHNGLLSSPANLLVSTISSILLPLLFLSLIKVSVSYLIPLPRAPPYYSTAI